MKNFNIFIFLLLFFISLCLVNLHAAILFVSDNNADPKSLFLDMFSPHPWLIESSIFLASLQSLLMEPFSMLTPFCSS